MLMPAAPAYECALAGRGRVPRIDRSSPISLLISHIGGSGPGMFGRLLGLRDQRIEDRPRARISNQSMPFRVIEQILDFVYEVVLLIGRELFRSLDECLE